MILIVCDCIEFLKDSLNHCLISGNKNIQENVADEEPKDTTIENNETKWLLEKEELKEKRNGQRKGE